MKLEERTFRATINGNPIGVYIYASVGTDLCPDLSFYGEWVAKATEPYDIDRQYHKFVDQIEEGEEQVEFISDRLYWGFRPASADWREKVDDDVWRRDGIYAWERMEAYERGDWEMLFIQAHADIWLLIPNGGRRFVMEVTSSGLSWVTVSSRS